jgi:hypothetical protein
MGLGIVDIFKVATSGPLVTYEYVHDNRATGRFTIHTETGVFSDETVCSNGNGVGAHYAARHKVTVAWRAGELPEKLTWAG